VLPSLKEEDDALVQETPDEKEARKRSYKNPLYRFFFVLTTHWTFSAFITIMIILNTVSLALDTFDVSEKMEEVLGVFNYIFTWLFTAEMIFKLIGLGPKQYVKDYYNVFDCCIVILSLIDFILSISIPKENIG